MRLTSKIEQDKKGISDSEVILQSLRATDLKHPALARLRHKIDNQNSNSDMLMTYSEYSRSCFPAGTEVLLADRTTKVIEQISVGDMVMGFDGSNPVPARVESLESPLRDHLCILSFADGPTVRLTHEHPLYTTEGWRSLSPESTAEENAELLVGKLEIGDRVLTIDGVYQTLVDIVFKAGQVQTYNLKKLSRYDNFFANGFLAHNKAQISLCGKCEAGYADFACWVGAGCGATHLISIGGLPKTSDEWGVRLSDRTGFQA